MQILKRSPIETINHIQLMNRNMELGNDIDECKEAILGLEREVADLKEHDAMREGMIMTEFDRANEAHELRFIAYDRIKVLEEALQSIIESGGDVNIAYEALKKGKI